MGPIKMSANQITASILASLIAIPPVTFVTVLFKKTRSQVQEKLKQEKYVVLKEKGIRKVDSEKSLAAKSMHYYWTYLAYTLAIVFTLISGFFTILFSMAFGKEKANRWAVTALSGFFQGIIIIQPLKVAALSMFIASILRKVDQSHITDSTNSDELSTAMTEMKRQAEEDEASRNGVNLEKERLKASLIDAEHEVENPEAFEPPSKLEQKHARKTRKKDKHMTQVMWEMFGYVQTRLE